MTQAEPAGEGGPGAAGAWEEPGHAADPEGDELEQLLGELGAQASEYRIRVERVHANADPEECFDCPLPTFSKDQLRADYGPGHYRAEVRKGGKIKRRWDWRFARPLVTDAGSRANVSPLAGLERSPRERELEAELAAARARAADRTHELLLALIQRPQPSGGDRDLLQTLVQAKDLLGLGADNRGGPKETLGLVRELLELRDELGGGGGERETTAADVVRAGLDKLPELTELLRAAAAIPDPPAGGDTSRSRPVTSKSLPAPPPRAPAPAATSTNSSAAVSRGESPMLLAQFVPMVLKLAQGGMTAAAAAGLITPKLNELDDNQFSFLATIIAHPECVPMLIRAEPRLAPIRPWLEQLAGELRAFISRETAEEPLPDAPAPPDAARASTEGTHDPAPRGGRTPKGSARGAAKR